MQKIFIVVAEDDISTQVIYRHILPGEAFDLKIARDGREALELYHSLKPDIMVLDIMLPFKTGYSVLKEIRLQCWDKKTPVIMATSVSRKESVQDCIALGVQGYIVKPLVPGDALERILAVCETVYPEKTRAAREALAPQQS